MIFLPSGVSFTLWQAALLRYLWASWLARSAHTESKALLSSCNFVGDNAHEEILLRCAQKSNHLRKRILILLILSILVILLTLSTLLLIIAL